MQCSCFTKRISDFYLSDHRTVFWPRDNGFWTMVTYDFFFAWLSFNLDFHWLKQKLHRCSIGAASVLMLICTQTQRVRRERRQEGMRLLALFPCYEAKLMWPKLVRPIMVGYLAQGNVHSADISGWISAENVVKVALSLYMFIYSFFELLHCLLRHFYL